MDFFKGGDEKKDDDKRDKKDPPSKLDKDTRPRDSDWKGKGTDDNGKKK